MLSWWQNLPLHINPIVFSIGSFSITWYSLMYLVGFVIVYGLLYYRIKRGKADIPKSQIQNFKSQINPKIPNTKYQILNTKQLLDLMFYLIIGLLVGARLGYVFFYDFEYTRGFEGTQIFLKLFKGT